MMNGKTLSSLEPSRRRFLKGLGTAAISAPYLIPSTAIGADGNTPPSERVTMGFIGVGGRGTAELKAFLLNRDVQVVAVCDPFLDRREAAKQLIEDHYEGDGSYKGCTAYRDFRELLQRDDIDAVDITTQDSWHVPQAIAAAEAKKDIQIAKPLGFGIAEQRALCKAIEENNVVFQFSTQQRHGWTFQMAVDLVKSGRIGRLHTIRVGSPASQELQEQPEIPVPDGFDYNLWLGPAPHKAYSEKRCVTPWWWFISDYTFSGFVAGWGVHHIDIAQWGNDADRTGPVEIDGSGVFPRGGLCDTALAWNLRLKYTNGVELIYSDARQGEFDRRSPSGNDTKCEQGVRFEGTEGWVFVNRGEIDAEPLSLLGDRAQERKWAIPYVPQVGVRDFLDCVKSRQPAKCDVETAHRTTTVCHLSHICLLLGRKLRWDPVAERFPDDDEANALLTRTLRDWAS